MFKRLNHSIADIIEKARLDTIKALLTPFNTMIEKLINIDQSLCKQTSNRQRHLDFCLSSMLGTSIQSLRRVGLWPIPHPTEYKLDVMALSENLKNVKIESKDPGQYINQCSHGPFLKGEIEKALSSIPPLLTEAHKRYFERQARKSGISM